MVPGVGRRGVVLGEAGVEALARRRTVGAGEGRGAALLVERGAVHLPLALTRLHTSAQSNTLAWLSSSTIKTNTV